MEKFLPEELAIILGEPSQSYQVFNVENNTELEVLQANCTAIDPTDENLKILISRMYATVQDENHKGVGIAAPQVGINRRVFIAQRMDKQDHPFEFFINPEITWYSKIQRLGEEGCLSIPNLYKEVMRSLVIQITYFDLSGKHFHEIVEGYTAVIMQHEYDHLNGVLFPDRIDQQSQEDYFDAVPPTVNLKYKK